MTSTRAQQAEYHRFMVAIEEPYFQLLGVLANEARRNEVGQASAMLEWMITLLAQQLVDQPAGAKRKRPTATVDALERWLHSRKFPAARLEP